MSKEVIEALRKQAGEIAKEGHFGWGNTMTAAADALDTLLAERDRLKTALEGIVAADWSSSETATDFAISQTKGFLISQMKQLARAALQGE